MLEYKKISEYPDNTLYKQLEDAYSFAPDCKKYWNKDWEEYNEFFYNNLDIADNWGFITVLNGTPIGHISWDPRNLPEYVTIGHNCIISKYKHQGYGKRQLEEAVKRIKKTNPSKIIVTTNELLFPAQKNYESVGFEKIAVRINTEEPFAGNYIDYELKGDIK